MNKKILIVIPFLFSSLTACQGGNFDNLKVGLDNVTNLTYKNQAIYFDRVENATQYRIEIEHASQKVLTKDISVNQYDIETLNLIGNNVAYVTAFNKEKKSETAKLEFAITNIDRDVIYEGEHGLLNYGSNDASNYRNNPLAHNGAYAGGIDDCGNGLHFDHYSFLSGERDLEIYYLTDQPHSYHDVLVNGANQARVYYEEKTGWGGVDNFNVRKVTTKITLQEGWNNIELVKCGTSSDNPQWGGFAEVDYVVIKGTGVEYNVDKETGIPTFKLQAEMGTAIKWDDATQAWTTKNPAKYYPSASNNYMLGNVDNEGEGVDIHINVPKKGLYKVKMAYAQNNDPTLDTFATITTDAAPRLRVKLDLPTRSGWGTPTLSEWSDTIELNQDGNHIYIKKTGSTEPFEMDYILLEYVGEITE